ncbi:MAG: hypothetical protein ACFFE8_12150 [Candidatus Heimdallarchaeota archaeon]
MVNLDELKDRILREFPGKMEKENVLIMSVIMKEVEQGKQPPKRDDIESAIKELISDGIFEKKDGLLILRKETLHAESVGLAEKESKEEVPVFNPTNYPPDQAQILLAFGQAKYENRSALIMGITMKELQNGNQPPRRGEIEQSIQALVKSGALEAKGEMLIRKI